MDVFFQYAFFFFLILFIYLFIYLFIFGCVGSSVRARAFSSCGKRGATLHRGAGTALHRGARAFHYRGPSRCGAQAPDAQAQ